MKWNRGNCIADGPKVRMLADERLWDERGEVCGDRVGDSERHCAKGDSRSRLPLEFIDLDKETAKTMDVGYRVAMGIGDYILLITFVKFPSVAQMLYNFCPISSCLSRIGQTVET